MGWWGSGITWLGKIKTKKSLNQGITMGLGQDANSEVQVIIS